MDEYVFKIKWRLISDYNSRSIQYVCTFWLGLNLLCTAFCIWRVSWNFMPFETSPLVTQKSLCRLPSPDITRRHWIDCYKINMYRWNMMDIISLKYHLWWCQIFNFATNAAHLFFSIQYGTRTRWCVSLSPYIFAYLLTHDKFSGAVLWLVLFTP